MGHREGGATHAWKRKDTTFIVCMCEYAGGRLINVISVIINYSHNVLREKRNVVQLSPTTLTLTLTITALLFSTLILLFSTLLFSVLYVKLHVSCVIAF